MKNSENEKSNEAVDASSGSRALADFIDLEVRPEMDAGGRPAAAQVIATLDRMRALFGAVAALEAPEHYEASSTLAASMFELYADLLFLSGDETGDMLKRRIEFFEIQKFRAAHRMVSFHDESGGENCLNVEPQRRFKEETGGIEEIRNRVARVWGPDKRGKSSYPVHWTGRKCTRVLCHELGTEYEELYIEAYAVLSWMLNCGLSGGGLPDEATAAEIFSWSQGVAQLSMAEDALLCIRQTCGGLGFPLVENAAGELRRRPGSTIGVEWFSAQREGTAAK